MAILAVGSSISPTPYFSASQSTRIKHPTRITIRFGLFRLRIVSLSSPLPDSQRPPTTTHGHGENLTPPHSLPAKSIGDTPSSQGPKFGTYAVANPDGNPVARLTQSAESSIERVIYDFRFLALLAIGGSLAGSLLCFLNGCVYIVDAYRTYWTCCLRGIHGGQMVLRLVEAIDVYLAGTVMLIFAMGLYGLFISNVPANVHPTVDRALKDSSLFGMFALKVIANCLRLTALFYLFYCTSPMQKDRDASAFDLLAISSGHANCTSSAQLESVHNQGVGSSLLLGCIMTHEIGISVAESEYVQGGRLQNSIHSLEGIFHAISR